MLATDAAFTSELDCFAADMAAANRAITDLHNGREALVSTPGA
ncbi:hypothetical protein [Streptomyces lydicus]